MVLPILNKLKKLWEVWDIPTCILLSLFLQFFLLLFASWRQRTRNSFINFLIWSAYLSADWIALVTIGLITKILTRDSPDQPHHVNPHLYAFWACFLLLHLGGPDSITSFALEDNEFWLRHLFGLILQVLGAAYCIFLTLPSNTLWVPTILVFVVGSVKYAERTMALYLASLDHFQETVPEPLNNAEPDFNLTSESPTHMELLMVSYSLLKSFKGILLGYRTSPKLVESSKKLFRQIKNPNLGFKLIEYELSLIYEVLHTKVAVVSSRVGFIFRLSSFFCIVAAFVMFHFDHDEFGGFELSLTYILLIGAIALDTISGIKLLLFSDWIMVSNNGLIKRLRRFIPEFVSKRRWSESVPQYNMIDYCLNERWLWKYSDLLPDFFRSIVDGIKFMLFSSSLPEDEIEDLKCFLFENKEIIVTPPPDDDFSFSDFSDNESMMFAELDNEFRYTEEVLLLHLVTEIGYHQTQTESSSYTEEGKRCRRICKMISDYMFYLLIKKPEIVGPSIMGINWEQTFNSTFEEAKRCLMKNQVVDHVQACNVFVNYNVVREEKDSSRQSVSVLSNACSRATKLKLEQQWKVLSLQWSKGLCLGSIRNRPVLHVKQASKGGELISFVWFIRKHFVPTDKDKKDEERPPTGR